MRDSEFDLVLSAAQAGDAWALEAVYLWLAPGVAGYLRAQGAVEVDDLTSEVFLSAFRRIESFRGHAAQFRSWVFTIAHSRLVDERRRWTRRHTMLTPMAEPVEQRGGDTEADAWRRLEEDRVRDLCGRLALDQRDVLLLRLIGDLTVEQVAALLGKSVGAVKALQRRGLATLRREFEREGVPL